MPLNIARDNGHSNIVEYLEKKLKEERTAQRKRRQHHGDHNRHYSHLSHKTLAIDSSDQPEIAASSGASSSSWINGLLCWVKSSIGGLLDFPSQAIIQLRVQSHKLIHQLDVIGTIMLLDLLIRRFTGQKYIYTADQSISPLEAQGYALNITKGCEKVVEQAGLKVVYQCID